MMRNPLRSDHPAEKVARAHADLIQFAIIEKICEGSDFSVPSRTATARIIKICKAEMQKCLTRGDAERLKLSKQAPEARE